MTDRNDDRIQKLYSLLVKLGAEIAEIRRMLSALAGGNGGRQ